MFLVILLTIKLYARINIFNTTTTFSNLNSTNLAMRRIVPISAPSIWLSKPALSLVKPLFIWIHLELSFSLDIYPLSLMICWFVLKAHLQISWRFSLFESLAQNFLICAGINVCSKCTNNQVSRKYSLLLFAIFNWFYYITLLYHVKLIEYTIFFLIGIHSMQGWTATTRHGVTRKRSTKRLKHAGNLFRKNPQLLGVC